MQKVKEFLKENLKLYVEVKESWKVKKDKRIETVVVKIKRTNKQIIIRKKNLKIRVYIDDDIIQKKREIQRKLKRLAGEKRREGKKTTTGYKKNRNR